MTYTLSLQGLQREQEHTIRRIAHLLGVASPARALYSRGGRIRVSRDSNGTVVSAGWA